MVTHIWSVLRKCMFRLEGRTKPPAVKSFMWSGKDSFKFVFRHLYKKHMVDWFSLNPCWPTHSAGKLHFRVLQACLTFVLFELQEHSVRSTHCPPPQPVSHTLSRKVVICRKMADRKSLIPSDIQCSSYLVYHADSHLSWAYINNYTASVSLIIVVSGMYSAAVKRWGIGVSSHFSVFF